METGNQPRIVRWEYAQLTARRHVRRNGPTSFDVLTLAFRHLDTTRYLVQDEPYDDSGPGKMHPESIILSIMDDIGYDGWEVYHVESASALINGPRFGPTSRWVWRYYMLKRPVVD